MKILICRWDIYPYSAIIQSLQKQGHQTDVLAFPMQKHLSNPDFEQELEVRLQKTSYDYVFTVNYFTVIAKVCYRFADRHKSNLLYLSWTCDTPLVSMHHPSVFLPTNRIFTFDRKEYETFRKQSEHIYYLPLASSPGTPVQENDDYWHTVTFVGNLYDKNRYDELEGLLPDYLCGYLDAAIEAQMLISGGNVLPSMLTDSIMEQLEPYLSLQDGDFDYEDSKVNPLTSKETLLKLHFATSVLSYQTAARTRRQTLNYLAGYFPVDLYTTSDTSSLSGICCHSPVDYHTQMPVVFAHSKININMTIPNIESGIPLRVWDILGAGGFLLTDYRPEYEFLLENGKDLVIYEGLEDLAQKITYYLSHEEERKKIAANGQRNVLQSHSYDCRIRQMLDQSLK